MTFDHDKLAKIIDEHGRKVAGVRWCGSYDADCYTPGIWDEEDQTTWRYRSRILEEDLQDVTRYALIRVYLERLDEKVKELIGYQGIGECPDDRTQAPGP